MHGFFYNSALKNYENVIASLFSDIYVMKKSGGKTFMNRVPLNFADATREYKIRDRINTPTSDYNVAKVGDIYPKINLKQVDVVPNPNFAVGSSVYIDKYGIKQFSPIPINMLYELNIQTKSKNDSNMILEQILPYLRPHFTVTIKEIMNGEVQHIRDMKLVYQTTSINNDTMGDVESNDVYDWSIIFEMVGYIYPPQIYSYEQGNVIETVFLNFKQTEVTISERFHEGDIIEDDQPNELTPSGEFESHDMQVKDMSIDNREDWIANGSETIHSSSQNIPVPMQSPSRIRGYDYNDRDQ